MTARHVLMFSCGGGVCEKEREGVQCTTEATVFPLCLVTDLRPRSQFIPCVVDVKINGPRVVVRRAGGSFAGGFPPHPAGATGGASTAFATSF